MSEESDDFLANALDKAISETDIPADNPACKAHEGIRKGVNVLLLCEKARMGKKNPLSFVEIGPVKATGWTAIVIALVYLSLKTHGLIP